MRQAITERLEAGFQGLEMLFRPNAQGVGRPVGTRLPPHDAGEVARGVAGMSLKQTTSMPPTSAAAWVPPSRQVAPLPLSEPFMPHIFSKD